METKRIVNLFLVDDDALFLKSLEIEFMHYGEFEIHTFPTGERCLEHIDEKPDIVVLDYHLNGIQRTAMDGIDVLDQIKEKHPEIPVIMLSSQDKIEVAINCMHHHAHDYVVKSETSFIRLQKIITAIFEVRKMEKALHWYMDRM